MTLTLNDCTPQIVRNGEEAAIKQFSLVVQDTVWSPQDLEDFLIDQDLSDYEANNYAWLLIDFILENDLGYEYGGITPWCGEGYSLYI
jgi:hypothetical protein